MDIVAENIPDEEIPTQLEREVTTVAFKQRNGKENYANTEAFERQCLMGSRPVESEPCFINVDFGVGRVRAFSGIVGTQTKFPTNVTSTSNDIRQAFVVLVHV